MCELNLTKLNSVVLSIYYPRGKFVDMSTKIIINRLLNIKLVYINIALIIFIIEHIVVLKFKLACLINSDS